MVKKQSGTISKRMRKRAEQRRKKRQSQIILAVIMIIILVGGVWAIFGNNFQIPADVKSSLPIEISIDEAYERYQAGDYLLDVRTKQEWDDFHIPETAFIPLNELESRVSEVPRDKNIVVVCRSGNRSREGRNILLDFGFSSVTSMNGGVSGWKDAGYPIE
jgi:rhodanese-related sulfurtransferase